MGLNPCVQGKGDGVNMEVVDQGRDQGIGGSLHEEADEAAEDGRDVGVMLTVHCGGGLFHLQGPTQAPVALAAAAGQMMLLPWQHLA
jgi:hypothetical protein